MKALSIRQPWAALVVAGVKDVENRQWRTNVRGRILVHAGQSVDFGALDLPMVAQAMCEIPVELLSRRGGIVGEVEITDCVAHYHSAWKERDSWGFILANAKVLPFVACRGKLGFFEVEDGVAEGIRTLDDRSHSPGLYR